MRRDGFKKLDTKAIASSLLLIETVLVFALGIFMIALGFSHDKDWLPFLSVIAFAFVGAGGLYALSRGIKLSQKWANSPAILANLIALGVSKYQFEAGTYWLAIPISVMSLTVIAAVILLIRGSNNSN